LAWHDPHPIFDHDELVDFVHGQQYLIQLGKPTVARRLGKLYRHPPRRLEVIYSISRKLLLVFIADGIHSYTTLWQYADSGTFPGDQDLFNGDAAGLSQYCVSMHLSSLYLR
jgi:hypothetical protein